MKEHKLPHSFQFTKQFALVLALFLGLQPVSAQTEDKKALLDKLEAEILELLDGIDSSTPAEIFETAVSKATQGIEISREIKSLEKESLFTFALARVFEERGDRQKTLEYYENTLKVINTDKETKATLKGVEIMILRRMGTFYKNDVHDTLEALRFYTRALALYKENEEDEDKGLLLRYSGALVAGFGFYAQAEEFHLKAIGVFQRLKLPLEEGVTLGKLGGVYSNHKHKLSEALKCLLESEKLLENSPDNSKYHDQRLLTLTHLYFLYERLNAPAEASFYRNKAIKVQEKTANHFVRFASTVTLGRELEKAGELEAALRVYKEALVLATKPGIVDSSHILALRQTWSLCIRLRKFEEARKYFEQAFDLAKRSNNHAAQADLAMALANSAFRGGAFEIAEDYYALAFSAWLTEPVWMSKANRSKQVDFESVVEVQNKLGIAQLKNGNKSGGLVNLRAALSIQMSLDQETNLAEMLQDRMTVFAGLKKRSLAIFFGKQAVALKQEIRRTLKTLPVETQRSFLKGTRETYETLASLLIQENRLGEALQILNLYQNQEFFDFGNNGKHLRGSLSFTGHEKEALAELLPLQASLRESKENFIRNPNGPKLEAALKKFEEDFRSSASAKDRVSIVPDVAEMQTVLRELEATTNQRSAAIYTLIAPKKIYLLLLMSSGEIKVYKSSVEADALNSKILRFFALLQSPAYDPRRLGRELHAIIFKPLEAELKRQNIRTLMWQLDGSLRYVPMAALWDGERYLVERFQNVIFTRLDRERMTRSVSRNWTGTGFGSSEEHTVDVLGDGDTIKLPALPGVTRELQEIFRLAGEASQGILDGEVFVDAKFTKTVFLEAMKRHRPLVHVSSHFSFRPGDGARSFMLLGDGTALTLEEMKNREGLFSGVELLTLSACNTAATQSDAHGKEIDAFAELAQRLGAGSVMATLWQVSDDSTPWLMKEFYSVRQSKGGTTKAGALRNAQLALLRGRADTGQISGMHKGGGTSNVKIVVVPDASTQIRNLTRAEIVYVSEMDAPLFKYEEQKKFAHPYYWAPFILIGNWL
jgi:CHAT domain-containing protein